ncbi:MAG: ATPase [ANME-2 cluster archaeon]|jgi:flagellar protein FlaH|nr:ATPase [ANME-2 cluster archaeon]
MSVLSFEVERDEFNRRLGNGFPDGSIAFIEGDNGSGKSSISQRITYGLLENGYTVTLISTQLTTKGFINQMYSLDYPVASHLLKNNLLYIPVLPLIKSSKNRIDFIERLMNAEALFKKNVIIIDTISALIKQSADTTKGLELISFLKKITGMGKTVILTANLNELDNTIYSQFISTSDIYFTLKVRPLGNEIKRTIIVNKFTGARSPVGSMVGFRIESKVGLVVEIASVA